MVIFFIMFINHISLIHRQHALGFRACNGIWRYHRLSIPSSQPEDGFLLRSPPEAPRGGNIISTLTMSCANFPSLIVCIEPLCLLQDSLIAFTWDHFLNNPDDAEWLVRLPMVKASVRAMDAISKSLNMLVLYGCYLCTTHVNNMRQKESHIQCAFCISFASLLTSPHLI